MIPARQALALVTLAGCLGLGSITGGGLSVALLTASILLCLTLATHVLVHTLRSF